MFSAFDPEPEAKITIRFIKFKVFVAQQKKELLLTITKNKLKDSTFFFNLGFTFFSVNDYIKNKFFIFAENLNLKIRKLCQTLHQE